MADEMVKVKITASQRIYYRQTKLMKRSEWEELKKTPCGELGGDSGPIGNWLDLDNPVGADDFDGVEMIVVDEKGKPVQPVDEYTD